jgi:hypothetical protein
MQTEVVSSNESVKYDDDETIWNNILEQMNGEFEDRINSAIEKGLSQADAQDSLLPLMHRRYSQLLADKILVYQNMTMDPIYIIIQKECRRIETEDGLDKASALDAAIRNKRYLIDQKMESLMDSDSE